MKELHHSQLSEQELATLERRLKTKLKPYPDKLKYDMPDHGFDFEPVSLLIDESERCLLVGRINGELATPRIMTIEDGELKQRPAFSEHCRGKLETAEGYATKKIVRLHPYEGKRYELIADIIDNDALELNIELRVSRRERTVITYDTSTQQFIFDRTDSSLSTVEDFKRVITLHAPLTSLHCFVYEHTIEIFINDGEAVMSTYINTTDDADGIRASALRGQVYLKLSKYDLSEV